MRYKIFKKGVTLIEVLVASLLLAITISPMMYIYVQQQIVSEEMRLHSLAVNILQDEFESLKSRSDSQVAVNLISPYTASNPKIIAGIEGGIYKVYYAVSEVALSSSRLTKVFEVKCTVTWKSSSLSMVTRTNNYRN